MKKHILKINTFILSFFITMPTYLMHVEASEELVIKNISNAILSIVSWFAYAIALGALIFFGIKYMMSGANEKANLKGMLPKYLIGMALIVFCFVIASGIAEIAGNDDAREIIDVGKEAGDHFAGGGTGENCEHSIERKYLNAARTIWVDECTKCGMEKRGSIQDECEHTFEREYIGNRNNWIDKCTKCNFTKKGNS